MSHLINLQQRILEPALDQLLNEHGYLLTHGLCERCITHHLATKIERQLSRYCSGLSVDTEYNKTFISNLDRCKLGITGRKTFPDIVIHVRGEQADNLAAIELKIYKKRHLVDLNDARKLSGYRTVHFYKHAYFISLLRTPFAGRYMVTEMNDSI